ncbi:Protein STU1 [Lachancea thermotolerans]
MADSEDGDFTSLPLSERLDHKLWKARLHGYQELQALFQKASVTSVPRELAQYWANPDLFAGYIVDSNVVAQEQAITALQNMLEYLCEFRDTPRSDEMRGRWLPLLAEKGLSSSRNSTKAKAQECVLILVSLDRSVEHSIELLEPSLTNKLPRLVANCVECISNIVESFGLAQVSNMSGFLPVLLEPLPKLSSHADRNVRSQTMNLILQLYKWLGRDLLQELLLEKLKPIQQRDLDKTFGKYDGEIPPTSQPRPFQWQKGLEVQNLEDSKDKDGDTLMGESFPDVKAHANPGLPQLDPFELLPASPVLEKFPLDFMERITSSKWKDRVEVLEEILNQVLIPTKKFEAKGQDYSDFLRAVAHVIEKDANVQAVTLAAQCVQQLCQKLKANFTRSYGSIVLRSLLERSKEKKASVNEAICEALNNIADCCGVDACLEDTLSFINHKTPQVRTESTRFLTRLLKKWTPEGRHFGDELLIKLVPDISQMLLKIVGDTQPTVRDAGFECLATLMKLVGEREVSDVLDKLDNLKKKKVYEHYEKVEVAGGATKGAVTSAPARREKPSIPYTPNASRRQAPRTTPTPDLSAQATSGSTLPLRKPLSTIPSKRGPSSPLKTGTRVETYQDGASSMKSRLTARSLTTDSAPASKPQAAPHAGFEELQRQKQKWLKERQEFLATITDFQNKASHLSSENSSLRQQLDTVQSSLHESNIELRSKEMQITRLQDRISNLEQELEAKSTLPSSNYGVRSASSFEPPSAPLSLAPPGTPPTKRVFSSSSNGRASPSFDANSDRIADSRLPSVGSRLRSPSECSDDLPHRVNSLQLRSAERAATTGNSFLNDESWKRAAEVTSQLKARIERMRAKTRGMGNS